MGPSSPLYNGYRVFPGSKERPRRDAAPHPLLVPWSRKSRAIPLLLLRAVRSVQSVSFCTRGHLYLYLTVNYIAENCQRCILQNYRQLENYCNTVVLNRVFCGGGGAQEPQVGQGLLFQKVSRSNTTTHHNQ